MPATYLQTVQQKKSFRYIRMKQMWQMLTADKLREIVYCIIFSTFL